MALRTIGAGSSLGLAVGVANTSAAFTVQSDTIRVVAQGSNVFVNIDAEPVDVASGGASRSSFLVSTGDPEEIRLNKASQRVVGVTTGLRTILTCPEGTQMPFGVGDRVTLSSANLADYTTAISHVEVLSVNTSAGVGGNFQTSITVNANTAGILTAFHSADSTLRRSVKLSALAADGAGAVYFQQVQRN